MSRFDAFAKSRASGRGLFRSWRGSRQQVDGDEYGTSRRDVITRIGIVSGAAIVGSSLIQSVSSPAFAAISPGCFDPNFNCGGPACATCPNGAMCATGSDCTSGVCSNQTCVAQDPIANGSNCTGTTSLQRDFSCASEYCGDDGRCAPRPIGTVPNGSPCHGVTDYQASVQCVDSDQNTCYGWTVLTSSGTCRKQSGAPCATPGRDVTCGTEICLPGNKCA